MVKQSCVPIHIYGVTDTRAGRSQTVMAEKAEFRLSVGRQEPKVTWPPPIGTPRSVPVNSFKPTTSVAKPAQSPAPTIPRLRDGKSSSTETRRPFHSTEEDEVADDSISLGSRDTDASEGDEGRPTAIQRSTSDGVKKKTGFYTRGLYGLSFDFIESLIRKYGTGDGDADPFDEAEEGKKRGRSTDDFIRAHFAAHRKKKRVASEGSVEERPLPVTVQEAFAVLQLDSSATREQAKERIRTLVLLMHPDKLNDKSLSVGEKASRMAKNPSFEQIWKAKELTHEYFRRQDTNIPNETSD